MNIELALWQWSSVQVTSVPMIAVFFAVLWRSVRRAEMRWWVYAWSANFVALAVMLVAAGLMRASVQERIDPLRARLPGLRGEVAIGLSFGTAELTACGQPDAALHAADEAMYRAKAKASRRFDGEERKMVES